MTKTRTALHRRTSAAIRAWCRSQKMRLIRPLSHVHPRCYIIARVAESCLIVAVPRVDREPHLRGDTFRARCDTIHRFDPTLEQGDWCSTAYVSIRGSGQPVAIKVVA